MKRFHVHVMVKDLENSIGFYRMLFGEAPTVIKDDYAKWMLDDPRVNFAISTSGAGAIDYRGSVGSAGTGIDATEGDGNRSGRGAGGGDS